MLTTKLATMHVRCRAYIMLETVIAGGVVAVGLTTTIVLISGARFEATMAARRAEASALAMATADALMGNDSVTSSPLAPVADHPGLSVGFTIEDQPLVQSSSTPALHSSSDVHKITVTVQFPTSQGPQTLTHERLRRRPR